MTPATHVATRCPATAQGAPRRESYVDARRDGDLDAVCLRLTVDG
jgi:hypothetical protein